jgi:hypothetical protein
MNDHIRVTFAYFNHIIDARNYPEIFSEQSTSYQSLLHKTSIFAVFLHFWPIICDGITLFNTVTSGINGIL